MICDDFWMHRTGILFLFLFLLSCLSVATGRGVIVVAMRAIWVNRPYLCDGARTERDRAAQK